MRRAGVPVIRFQGDSGAPRGLTRLDQAAKALNRCDQGVIALLPIGLQPGEHPGNPAH